MAERLLEGGEGRLERVWAGEDSSSGTASSKMVPALPGGDEEMRLGRDDPPGRWGTGEGIGAVRSIDCEDAIWIVEMQRRAIRCIGRTEARSSPPEWAVLTGVCTQHSCLGVTTKKAEEKSKASFPVCLA